MSRPVVTRSRQPYPWLVPDLFRWFFLLGLSIVGIVMSWWAVSGTARTSSQLTWLDVGVAAVILAGLGNMTWLLQGRRAVAVRRREIFAALAGLGSPPDLAATADDDGIRVAVPGTSRHHRPGCPSVQGKPIERMSLAKHERAGRRPCGICSGG